MWPGANVGATIWRATWRIYMGSFRRIMESTYFTALSRRARGDARLFLAPLLPFCCFFFSFSPSLRWCRSRICAARSITRPSRTRRDISNTSRPPLFFLSLFLFHWCRSDSRRTVNYSEMYRFSPLALTAKDDNHGTQSIFPLSAAFT